jgi:hypothetical protein
MTGLKLVSTTPLLSTRARPLTSKPFTLVKVPPTRIFPVCGPGLVDDSFKADLNFSSKVNALALTARL